MTIFQERPCRVCGSALDSILDLGQLHPSGFLAKEEEPLPKVPFDLCVCGECRLVQLRHTVEPDLMFRKYWYLSGINETMRAELLNIVAEAIKRVPIGPNDYVMDIGANDGTLLSYYPTDVMSVAFEPAQNLNEQLHQFADMVVADYFPRGLSQLDDLVGRVKIITSIACFYDLDEPISFVAAIKSILHKDGVWIVQFQDWDQMQAANAFDNITPEHLVYYSLASFERLIEPLGLEVFDADVRKINGGSYRLYVGHTGRRPESLHVEGLRHLESGCEDWDTFTKFAWRCEEVRRQLMGTLEAYTSRQLLIDVYGASTKFNTLAQWCGIDHTIVKCAWERSPDKVGLRTPGTNIPIVSEDFGRRYPPQALLVGIWQFREAIMKRELEYLRQRGQLIFPLPDVDIVSLVSGSAH